ncbi:MAG: hypothetical protein ABJF10_10325 [Chthoniobacter sp.]|uniref:hypothetical protein n=1 Tax=Chthoniobacter sp. TaxID=2510640 RepID=UPI0032A2ED79
MKWFWILIVVSLGASAYYYRSSLQEYASHALERVRPESQHEKEVRQVFNRYIDLVAQGDIASENVYMPNATIVSSSIDAQGKRHEKSITVAQSRITAQKVLPLVKSGRFKIRVSDVKCQELADGTVKVTSILHLSDTSMGRETTEPGAMTFVNTAPGRWAVIKETDR